MIKNVNKRNYRKNKKNSFFLKKHKLRSQIILIQQWRIFMERNPTFNFIHLEMFKVFENKILDCVFGDQLIKQWKFT